MNHGKNSLQLVVANEFGTLKQALEGFGFAQ